MSSRVATPYPIIRMGEIATLVKRPTIFSDNEVVRSVGVKWYGKGTYIAEEKPAHELKASRFFVHADDLIYNDMWARNGSVAIVPQTLHNTVASAHFPTWELDLGLVYPPFLSFYFQTPSFWADCESKSQGSTGRNAITKTLFRELLIPLPPIDEQRRIVAHVEALAERISEAHGLRHGAVEEAEALNRSKLAAIYASLLSKYGHHTLSELIVEAGYGTSVKCDFQRGENAVPVLRIPNIASERINFNDLKFGVISDNELDRVTVSEGDILVVRTNGSADLVGRSAVIPALSEKMAFASYLICLRCNTQYVLADYVQIILKHHRLTGRLFDFARTTAGQYNVSLGRLRAVEIPIPPLDEQQQIIAYLDQLQRRGDMLKHLQAETAAELDALLPSVLDRAFKGEL